MLGEELVAFFLQLELLERDQPSEDHVEDVVGLDLGQGELVHEPLAGFGRGPATCG